MGGITAVLLLVITAVGVYFFRSNPSPAKVSSIAVLPFVNATSDPGNEYLSDGLTESLIGTLSQLPDLKVMARSTVFRFKGDQEDTRQIGEKLKVGAVFGGAHYQRGDEVAIQADLVSTADGSELWGSRYVRKMADITQVQGDITRDVSNSLRIRRPAPSSNIWVTQYSNAKLPAVSRRPPALVWSYAGGLKKSIDLFQQAIAADPNYALAYTGLAETYTVAPAYGVGITSRQARLVADDATRKALELDPSLAEAHTARQ